MSTPDPTRALIVEDDPVVARSIARQLLREGYTVSLASTCRAARATGAGFRVAILDLDLPDGSGAELAAELLELGSVQHVVFYTGSMDFKQRERAQALGSVVDKSSDVDDVVALLGPSPKAAPISHMAPAMRPRPRASGARLSRVSEAEAIAKIAATKRASRR